MNKVKLFISDIDGTLTDSTTYYSCKGEELKQFSHKDGMGIYLLHTNSKVKTVFITSEIGGINRARAKKLLKLKTLDLFFHGNSSKNKIEILFELCKRCNCHIDNIAYIGDDVNDLDCLKAVGFPACPCDAHKDILNISNIYITENKGGHGAVRDFIDYLIDNDFVYRGLNGN